MPTRTLAALLALLCGAFLASAEPPVSYTVRLDRPQTQVVTIEMQLRGVTDDTVSLLMPTWRPGKYLVLDNASDIRTLRAFAPDGGRLAVRKDTKSTWVVNTAGADEIRVVYDLYCNNLSDRTRHVDDSHAFLSGSAVFLLWPEHRHAEHTVRFDPLPAGWSIATGLESIDDRTVIAPDYDILVDSPIEVGQHRLLRFQVDGVPHEIMLWGQANYDEDRLRRDFADIVREQAAIFGDMPYERYLFLVHVAPGLGGGTEHYNSTVMHARPTTFDTPDGYRGFLGLAAHEMFHTWNVKRFRPAGLSPYDYLTENYTPSLWLVEGTTSYYDDLTLVRAGLIDLDEYLSRISGSISGYEARPGRLVQSLEESSHDAWIKHNRAGPDRDNTTISFYRKGALASLVLDAEIRRRTANRRSFDDVMRTLYERFPHGSPGYTADDIVEIASAVADSDFRPFFDSFIAGVDELPVDDALAAYGIEMVREPSKTAWEKEEKLDARPDKPWLGLNLSGSRVRSVVEGGPAFDAGLNADDEIVAINGRRAGNNFDDLEADLVIGQSADITYFRRDELRTVAVAVAARANAGLKLRARKDASAEQIAAFESWLDLSWPHEAEADGSDDDDARGDASD